MKMLKRLVVVVVVLLVLVIVVGMLMMNSLVRKGIEVGAGGALGTKTVVGWASVSLKAGQITIGDMSISNPEGFQEPTFFSMKQASVDVDMGSLLTDTIIIEEILIDKPVMMIERKGIGTNLNVILGNLGKNAREEQEKGEGKGYKIQRILITGTTTRFLLAGKDPVDVELPDIEIKGLGTGENNAIKIGGVTLAVLAKLAEETVKSSVGKVPGEMLKTLDGAVSGAKKAAEGIAKELEKGVEDAIKKLPELELPKLPGIGGDD